MQDIGPLFKMDHGQQRHGAQKLAPVVAFGAGAVGQLARLGHRSAAVALHLGRDPQKAPVMRVPFGEQFEALLFQAVRHAYLRRQRHLVSTHRVGIAAKADVQVRRHVQQMRRVRRQARQRFGDLGRADGVVGRIGGVRVVMNQAGVPGMRAQGGFEPVDQGSGARQRAQAHEVIAAARRNDELGLDEQRLQVRVLGVGVRQHVHLARVGHVQRVRLVIPGGAADCRIWRPPLRLRVHRQCGSG